MYWLILPRSSGRGNNIHLVVLSTDTLRNRQYFMTFDGNLLVINDLMNVTILQAETQAKSRFYHVLY